MCETDPPNLWGNATPGFFDFNPDQALKAQKGYIEKDGFGIITVVDFDRPADNPWMYTYGFALKDRPDFIAKGFMGYPITRYFKKALEQFSELNNGFLPDLYTQATITLRDIHIVDGDETSPLVRVRISVVPIEPIRNTMKLCWENQLGLNGPKSVYQILWPDSQNRLPGESDYENEFKQPEIGF